MASEKKQLSLEECAQHICTANVALQRHTDAYRCFQEAANHLHNLVHESKVDGSAHLPFVTLHFPSTNRVGEPVEFKMSLDSLPRAQLEPLAPLFDALCEASGNTLLEAWERIIEIASAAHPIVAEARHAQAADIV